MIIFCLVFVKTHKKITKVYTLYHITTYLTTNKPSYVSKKFCLIGFFLIKQNAQTYLCSNPHLDFWHLLNWFLCSNPHLVYYSRLTFHWEARHAIMKRKKLFCAHFPQLDLRVIFKPPQGVIDCFPFKDKVPKDVHSLTVYRYTCRDCNVRYIGKTKRHFLKRICEHQGISFRTKKSLQIKPF